MSKKPELPPRLKRLPKQGDLPVPFTAMVYQDRADFRVLNPQRVLRCYQERRCGVCREKLGREIVLIGGPNAVFVYRLFRDPAMHPECATFSSKTCPFLAKGKDYRDSNLPPGFRAKPTGIHTRDFLAWCQDYDLVEHGSEILIQAQLPWYKVELIGINGEPNREVDRVEVTLDQALTRTAFIITYKDDLEKQP